MWGWFKKTLTFFLFLNIFPITFMIVSWGERAIMWGWLKINLGLVSGAEQMRQKSQIPQMELKSILGSNVCLSTNRELIRGFIWNSSNSASLVSKVEPALPDWRFVQLVFLFETLSKLDCDLNGERASFLCLSLDCPNAYLEQEAFHVWQWAKEIENY